MPRGRQTSSPSPCSAPCAGALGCSPLRSPTLPFPCMLPRFSISELKSLLTRRHPQALLRLAPFCGGENSSSKLPWRARGDSIWQVGTGARVARQLLFPVVTLSGESSFTTVSNEWSLRLSSPRITGIWFSSIFCEALSVQLIWTPFSHIFTLWKEALPSFYRKIDLFSFMRIIIFICLLIPRPPFSFIPFFSFVPKSSSLFSRL